MLRLLIFIFTTVLATAWAQPSTTVGIILSGTGSAAEAGAIQLAAAQSIHSSWDVIIRNDQSSAPRAAEIARALAQDGASALVCCTTPDATHAVAKVAQSEGLLLFALTRTVEDPWIVQMEPNIADELTGLVAAVVRAGKQNVGMLAVDTPVNRELGTLLQQLGYLGSINVTEPVFVAANETELRPEMLWLASRELDALYFIGSPALLTRALAAGEQRGFEGDVYVPASTISMGYNATVHAMLPPATTAPTSLYGYRIAQYNALLADIVQWLEMSADGAFGVPIPIDTSAQWRQLLRDSLISLPPITGKYFEYDAHDDGRSAIVPQALRPFTLTGNRLNVGSRSLLVH